MCGSVTDQCYCGQVSGHNNWDNWQQQDNTTTTLVSTNNNMAADSYIRQFEEAYSASYSGSVTCKPSPTQCSPVKSHGYMSPAYYHQMSPNKQYHGAPEDPHHQPSHSHMTPYNSGYTSNDMVSDYIQPCHIFQVRVNFELKNNDFSNQLNFFQLDPDQSMSNVEFEYKAPVVGQHSSEFSSPGMTSHAEHGYTSSSSVPPPLFSQGSSSSSPHTSYTLQLNLSPDNRDRKHQLFQ